MDRRNEKKKTDVIWEITTILIEFLVTTYFTRKVYLQHSKQKKLNENYSKHFEYFDEALLFVDFQCSQVCQFESIIRSQKDP